MKKRSIVCIMIYVFAISSCVTAKVAPNAVNLGIEYNWAAENKCSTGISPEIRVSGIPEGTNKLKVSLTDLNNPQFNHGGGTVKYEGSNIINAGALKSYFGPCPRIGVHSYSIRVDAIDDSGKIIGFGKKVKKCCQF